MTRQVNILASAASIVEIGDTYTEDAVNRAKQLAKEGHVWKQAQVHRLNGLAVQDVYDKVWHFTTPLCGYKGTGPHTTAEILEMLGFGEQDDLFEVLSESFPRPEETNYIFLPVATRH